jgi:hypothetical protein
MFGEGMPELRVHQFGQRCRIGFVADVPGLQPSQLGVGRAGAGLGHLGQAQVDRVGQDRGQQQVLVLGQVARFQVREVPGEARPLIHLQQQFGDLDVRQDHRRPVDQRLRGVGHRRIERRDLQARLGDDGVRQLVGRAMRLTVASCVSSSVSARAGTGRSRWPRPAAIRWPA